MLKCSEDFTLTHFYVSGPLEAAVGDAFAAAHPRWLRENESGSHPVEREAQDAQMLSGTRLVLS